MEWRKCPLWPDYEVSDCGDVRRVVRRFGNAWMRKPYLASNGRMMLVMRREGISRACHVHRLVLEAFVGLAPSPRHDGAHNDGNPLNNALSNLRWATKSENQMDRVAHGTSNRGERFARSRLTNAQATEIKTALAQGARNCDLAKQYGVARATISSIKCGKSWFWLDLERKA